MLQILSLIAPVFGIIALGFLVARSGYMSEGAARTVTELGFKVAMPALLFRAMLSIGPLPVSPVQLAAAYFASVLVIWTLTAIAARIVLRRPPEDRPALAMAGCFGNGVMLGFPVIVTAFGPEAATPMAILATCDTVILWLMGTLHMEIARRDTARPGLRAVVGVLGEVARNPLIIALVAGAICRMLGVTLPPVPARWLDLLAQAAVPVSLVGLGMSLAAYRIAGEAPALVLILVAKLALAPAVGLLLATTVFGLPAAWAAVLVAFLAMPVGANAFLFASRYDRAVAPVSASVAVSTVLAVVTVTFALAVLRG
jgi:malonate transporter